MKQIIEKEICNIVGCILNDYCKGRDIDQIDIFNQPDKNVIIDMITKLQRIIFPGYFRDKAYRFYSIGNSLPTVIEDVMYNLNKQIGIALKYDESYADLSNDEMGERAQEITSAFLKTIPKIREYIQTDLEAALDGDPAAENMDEIIFSYPGFYAIMVNRLAHELFLLGVPVIPRIMTEYAHSVTGIDIHPGATLGKYFFIDHGTGIVIGETTVIGEHVKVYQGVTLGALSTKGGQALRHVKRHPTIQDNVTIYSGASILGGDTVIGENSVIGGNAFITSSIAPNTRVSVKNQELVFKDDKSVKKQDIEPDTLFFDI